MTKALSWTRILQQYILALFIAKLKVEILHKKTYNKTIISIDIKIYQPSKVIVTKAEHKDLPTLKSDIHLGFGLGE